MTDNARIPKFSGAVSRAYYEQRVAALETELATTKAREAELTKALAEVQADLERAREAMDYALAGFNAIYDMTRKKSEASNMAAYHAKKIRAALAPEQKGHPETTQL